MMLPKTQVTRVDVVDPELANHAEATKEATE
jgi:hypothetical protein